MVDFSPQLGREQAGVRPALVVSHDRFNAIRNDLIIVAPVSGTDRGLAYHVQIAPPDGGLTKTSVIMCDQVKSQSVQRFLRKRGEVSGYTLNRVRDMIISFFVP